MSGMPRKKLDGLRRSAPERWFSRKLVCCMIVASVTGLTADPTILDHAIKNSASYDAAIREKLKEGRSGGQSSANS